MAVTTRVMYHCDGIPGASEVIRCNRAYGNRAYAWFVLEEDGIPVWYACDKCLPMACKYNGDVVVRFISQ